MLALALLPGVAWGEELVLTADPGDLPLIIRGRHDAQTSTFSGNLRLTSSAAASEALTVLAPDLVLVEDPEVRIDRSYVAIPSGTTLSAGQPHDLRVTVSNVARAGRYRAVDRLNGDRPSRLVIEAGRAASLSVEIELRVTARPDVQLGGTAASFGFTRCVWLECLFGGLLGVPGPDETQTIHLTNRGHLPVELASEPLNVVLRGERSGEVPPERVVTLAGAPAAALVHGRPAPIALRVDTGLLGADRYKGELLFSFAGGEAPLAVPADVSVRHSPLFPAIVLLLALFLGRRTKGEGAPTNLARMELLFDLEVLDWQIGQIDAGNIQQQLFGKVNGVRQLVLDGEVDQARSELAEVRAMMDTGVEATSPARAAVARAENTAARLRAAPASAAAAGLTAPERAISWAAQTLSGAEARAPTRKELLARPLGYLLLLALLVAIGLQTLYLSSATFGSAGVWDYLSLVLWGMSADIAQRTLQDLPAPPAPT